MVNYIIHVTKSLLCIWSCWQEENAVPIIIDVMFYYSDVIMSAVESQITSILIVCSTICSGADQRKHQSSASLAFVRGIHWWPVNSPHKGPVTRKMLPFDDVIMCILCVAMVSNTLCFINTLRLRQNGCHFTCDIFKITDKWNWQYNRSLSRAKFGVMNNMLSCTNPSDLWW